jgi:hypothetical protein
MLKSTNYAFLLLVTIILASCNQQKSNNNSSNTDGNSSEINTITQNNQIALELHDKLMNHFSRDWMERESDPDLYPNYYGGSFIDNNGVFVIAVTQNTENVKETLK